MGNLIFGTTTVQGRTFDDIKIQTSKAGVPRPIVFGTARPIVGNIIATTSPRIVKKKEEQDGKGGPSVEVENEEVFRTYATRICEGPVTGITRVWRNNEIVYERDSENATQIENNTAFLTTAEFFLGGYDQMPSSVMQAAFGMNSVHGYRGTCYMVVDDENLTTTGGAIPQYAFEVERCEGFSLTSRPYAVESIEKIGSHGNVSNFNFPYKISAENMDVSPSVGSIFLRSLVVRYDAGHEIIDVAPSVESITLESVGPGEVSYDSPIDNIDVSAAVQYVSLAAVVVRYEYDVETLDISPSITGIEITSP